MIRLASQIALLSVALTSSIHVAAGPPAAGAAQLDEARRAFTYRGAALNPLLVQALTTGLADQWPGPVAVDVGGGQDSNRYFGEFTRSEDGRVDSKPAEEGGEIFGYQRIGILHNGQQVVQTWLDGGGTGVFGSLLLIEFALDQERDYEGQLRQRLVMRRTGEIGLSVNYDGTVSVEGQVITIGASSDCCGNDRGTVGRTLHID